MTAVDHAELKRVEGEGKSPVYTAAYDTIRKGAPGLSDATCSVLAVSINMKVAIKVTAPLLSEIEGLKAERDSWRNTVAFNERCWSEERGTMIDRFSSTERILELIADGWDVIESSGSMGEMTLQAPDDWEGDETETLFKFHTRHLRTQAPDSWRPDRAIQDIVAERERQQSVEGWSPGHDDEHDGGELAKAAACYAAGKIVSAIPTEIDPDRGAAGYRSVWPWDMTWWKPKTYRHNLVRAAALLVAEIERLDRRSALRPQTAESGK